MSSDSSQLSIPIELGMTRAAVCRCLGFPDLRDNDATDPACETWLYSDGGLEVTFEGSDLQVVRITRRTKGKEGLASLLGAKLEDVRKRVAKMGLNGLRLSEEYCLGRAQEFLLGDGSYSMWLQDDIVRSVSSQVIPQACGEPGTPLSRG